MDNDYDAYYLLVITDADGTQKDYRYNNAEAARGHARLNENSNPNGLRHLFKMLPNHEPIEVMV
jgi:hypothetical protein